LLIREGNAKPNMVILLRRGLSIGSNISMSMEKNIELRIGNILENLMPVTIGDADE
jgi:hypothetical protein